MLLSLTWDCNFYTFHLRTALVNYWDKFPIFEAIILHPNYCVTYSYSFFSSAFSTFPLLRQPGMSRHSEISILRSVTVLYTITLFGK